MSPSVAAIWVYPVKACQGVQVSLRRVLDSAPHDHDLDLGGAQLLGSNSRTPPLRICAHTGQVQSATLGSHGFALDRIFCVVDLEGTRHPK